MVFHRSLIESKSPQGHKTLLSIIANLKTDVRGAFNKFPDLFVQALKIVVDS